MDLDRIPLWSDRRDITVEGLWKAYCQFPYLPRLASFDVLAKAISDGVSKLAWQSETFAYAEGHDGNRWVGLDVAQHISARPSGLVVHPEVAQAQITADSQPAEAPAEAGPTNAGPSTGGGVEGGGGAAGTREAEPVAGATSFYGQFSLDSVRAIRQLEEILRNVVEHLNAAPGGAVKLTLEINASSTGFDDRVRRVVSENASQLGAKSQEFE